MAKAQILSIAAVAAVLTGCAAATQPAPVANRSAGECLNADRVNSFHPVGPNLVDVRVGTKDYYRLELAGDCHDIDFSTKVVLRARSSVWVCRAYDADLIVPDPATGVHSCPVYSVRKLTEAEAELARNR